MAHPLYGVQSNVDRDPKKIWLNRYMKVDRAFNVELNKALREAASDVDEEVRALYGRSGVGSSVRSAQLVGNKGVIIRILHELFGKTGELVEEYRGEAASQSIQAANVWDDEILRKIIPDPAKRKVFRHSLEASSRKNIASVITRVTGDQIPLSRKVYRSEALAKGQVQRVINSGLAKGDSALDIAKKARQFISPATPGGASFAARRLGRTEINNAFHAQAIESFQGRPWINQADWKLSGSHTPRPGDLCERYARTGTFPAGRIPKKPHPQCLCYITPHVESTDWIIDQLEAGRFDQWMMDNDLPVTDRVNYLK